MRPNSDLVGPESEARLKVVGGAAPLGWGRFVLLFLTKSIYTKSEKIAKVAVGRVNTDSQNRLAGQF